jgi:hypothetical protein
VSLVEQLFSSLLVSCANINCIEVIVCIDLEDKPTVKFFDTFSFPNLTVLRNDYFKTRGITKYYNYGAKYASGAYLWCLNDDVEILTKNWDYHVKQEIETYLQDKADRICYTHVEDDIIAESPQKDGPCAFPILTREFYDLTGWIVPPQMLGWGVDWAIGTLFDRLNYDRYLNLRPLVALRHHCSHNRRRDKDETYKRVANWEQWGQSSPPEEEINRCVELLNEYIEEFNGKGN